MEEAKKIKKYDERSGKEDKSIIQEEIKGWSWGGFGIPYVWGLFNGNWWGLLALIPFLGILVSILLGIKGKKWAWQDKKWESVEEFKRVQQNWDIFGFIFFWLQFVYYFVGY